MKKNFRLTIILMFTIILSFAPMGRLLSASEIPPQENISDAVIMQDSLYAVAGEKVLVYASENKSPETVLELSAFPDIASEIWNTLLLASDETKLYLISPFEGIVYEIKDRKATKKVKLDISSLGTERENGSRYVLFSYPVIIHEQLYLVYTSPETYSTEIYCFSLVTGERQKVSVGDAYVTGLYRYKDGKLMFMDLNTTRLLSLDSRAGNTVSTIGPLKDSGDGMIAYQADKDRLYFLSGNQVMRWEQGGRHQTIGVLPMPHTHDIKYAGIWKDSYTVLAAGGIHSYQLSSKNSITSAQKTTLTLWMQSDSSVDKEILTRFMLANPDITIRTIGAEDEKPLERLTFANLSQDPDIDLFVLPSSSGNSQAVFRRGYAAPIASPVLKESVLSMYPQVKDFMMFENQPFGYPVGLYPSFCSVRPDLLKETGLGEIPASYEEYIDKMFDWYARIYPTNPNHTFDGNKTIHSQQRHVISSLMAQHVLSYVNKDTPITFNTPEIKKAIEKVATLSRYQAMERPTSQSTFIPGIFDMESALSPFYRRINPQHLGEALILPPAVSSGDQPVIGSYLDYFIINPYSQNQEAAVKLIEFYSKNMPLVSKYMLYPNFNELVETKSYQEDVAEHDERISMLQKQIEETESMIARYKGSEAETKFKEKLQSDQDILLKEQALKAQTEQNRYEYLPQEIEECRNILRYVQIKDGWRMAYTDLESAVDIIFKSFEGQITLDQALSEIDRRLLAMYYEGQ